MSYQVLARKWRPVFFKDLVGQNSVVRILTNALKNRRLHPALIFSGPRGTGKTSTARILAKNLSCPDLRSYFSADKRGGFLENLKTWDLNPCNKCKTCRDIDESRYLDVLEIDGASHNGVEAVRQLKESITYLPSGPYKVYIIDEAHMLSTSAFNALLKTLEEPPPHALFIMATTEMRKIPATVLSRAQILQFRRITDDLIYEQLKKICEKENTQASEEALWMLVRESQGSLRDAQGLLDQMITFCHNEFDAQAVSDILGLSDRSLILKTLKNLLEKNSDQMAKLLGELQTRGADGAVFLQHLIREIRNLILLKSPSAESVKNLIPLSVQEKDLFRLWSKALSAEDLHILLDMALKGSWELNRVQDPKVFLEMLLLKMSQAPYVESLFGKKIFTENPLSSMEKKKPLNSETGKRSFTGGGDLDEGLSQWNKKSPKPSDLKEKKRDLNPKTFLKKTEARVKAPKAISSVKTKSPPLPEKEEKPPAEKDQEVREHFFIQQIQSLFKADILECKDRKNLGK